MIQTWLRRSAERRAGHLALMPARGSLSRGAVFAFFSQRPADRGVLALFYAAQRLAAALELRYRPYVAQLLALRLTAREREVLQECLRGTADRQIARQLGLTV
ncbi:MAG TPA: LuxR C-terminal-related transcriptional regulator, partial [Burkholderiaceae bacterium]|nr:LuxR C-terminal-related transcriptional regulator [Burkholderiaceae bacterium]